ncbi:hypothetical protein L1887_53381 [Cichorium endivia]|nr:hypothetical protein L1887_53381 [Cichorium endivia]
MFAPMSKGGSDDAWQAQDEAGSLKPGRFRAYLADQLLAPGTTNPTPASRSIPFPRDSGTSRRNAKPAADKGKARELDRGFMAGFLDNQPAAPSTSLGKRLANGFGFRQNPSHPDRPAGLRSGPAPTKTRNLDPPDAYYPKSMRDPAAPSSGAKSPLSSSGELGPSPFHSPPPRRRRVTSIRDRNWERERERERQRPNRSWLNNLIRPPREIVEAWLDSWWKRWFALAGLPSLVVWIWCAVPFPKTDPYDPNLPWCNPGEDGSWNDPSNPPWCYPPNATASSSEITSKIALPTLPTLTGLAWSITNLIASSFSKRAGTPSDPHPPIGGGDHLTVDANFWFFLVFYYGIYVGVALIYITQLFGLYRLNWWPAALGAKTSYTFFWIGSLVAGWILHQLDPLGTESRHRPAFSKGKPHDEPGSAVQQWSAGGKPTIDDADIQWQRKTLWRTPDVPAQSDGPPEDVSGAPAQSAHPVVVHPLPVVHVDHRPLAVCAHCGAGICVGVSVDVAAYGSGWCGVRVVLDAHGQRAGAGVALDPGKQGAQSGARLRLQVLLLLGLLYLLPQPVCEAALVRPVCAGAAAFVVLGLHLVSALHVVAVPPRGAVLQPFAALVGGVRRECGAGVLPAQPGSEHDDARLSRLGKHPPLWQQPAALPFLRLRQQARSVQLPAHHARLARHLGVRAGFVVRRAPDLLPGLPGRRDQLGPRRDARVPRTAAHHRLGCGAYAHGHAALPDQAQLSLDAYTLQIRRNVTCGFGLRWCPRHVCRRKDKIGLGGDGGDDGASGGAESISSAPARCNFGYCRPLAARYLAAVFMPAMQRACS